MGADGMIVFSADLGAGEGVGGGDSACTVDVGGDGGGDGGADRGADSCCFSKAMACMARAR